MKIHKKIWLGLGLVIGLIGIVILAPQKTLAFTADNFDHASYKVVPGPNQFMGEIDATINGVPVKFIDRDINDFINNYKPDSTDFCSNTALGASGGKGITLSTSFGDLSKGVLEASINVDFKGPRTGTCETYTNTLVFSKGADNSWTATATPPITYSAAWIDRSHIKVTGSDSSSVIVTDGKWDGKWEFTGTIDGNCTVTVNGFNAGESNLQPGYQVGWNASKSVANITVQRSVGTSCSSYAPPGFQETDHKFPIGDPANAQIAFEWVDADTIQRIDRPGEWTFTKASPPTGVIINPGATWFVKTSEVSDTLCRDFIAVLPGDTQMKLYENKPDPEKRTGVSSPIDNKCWLHNTIDKMDVDQAGVDDWALQVPSNFVLGLGKQNNQLQPPGSVTGTDDACFSSGWALSWLACPVITTAQTAANAMYGFVEDQLKFTVLQNCPPTPSNPKPNCADSLGQEHDSVHSAWSNFRILVSGLVVILLLVMVISQAIGTGPFDAYTVRKMLPRLVIGVILIQISWPLFSWVINTVEHLGVGLADLMYAPFGGADALNLSEVMKPFTSGTAEVFNWIGFLGVAIGAVVAPFLMLGIILTVLVAIFVGFLTLLFRKIIIILALIFVPVALISWMMPNDGLRKYWKLWWDNFSKALMMFPLIIAMIAGGRIFAKIGSAQHDFVGFFIVLIGFFGPLFILPKTFKWGGTLMKTAGQGIASAGQKGLKKPKEFLGERQKGYSEERTRQSRERYLRGEGVGFNRNWQRGFGVSSLWRRPIDLVKAGQVDPTLWGRRKETAMRKYRAAGAESEEADIKAADQEFGLLASQSDNHDIFARQVGGARIGDEITWTDKEAAARGEQGNRRLEVTADMKRAGMNGMAKFGTDRTFRELSGVIDELHHGNADEQILAERFLDANVGTLKPKMDYLYRGLSRVPGGSDAIPDWVERMDPATGLGTGVWELSGPVAARVGSLTPEAFASMEAPELEALLAGLSQVANHNADAGARAAAEERLRTIYTHYEGALDNDQIRRSMGSSLNQAMKAHLDGTDIAGINTARGQAGLTTDIEQVPTIMTPATAAIAARIGADGTAH